MSDRLIRVLLFTNTTARYGAEEHMMVLLRGLNRQSFRPYLACPPALMEQFGGDLPGDVEAFPLLLNHPSQLGAAVRFAKILVQRRITILHSHMFQSSAFGSPMGRLCGVPAIIETPHVNEGWRRGWFHSHFAVDRMIGRFVDYYVAVSEANAAYLTHQKGLSGRKVVVIRNGTDLQRFNPNRTPPPGLKRALGFHEDDPMLIVPARLDPQKGHRTLLDALPVVLQSYPRVRVVFVGEGSLRADLQRHVEASGLLPIVKFVGFQSNIEDWFAASEFMVLPSLYEGLPLAAVEALACGRAVVASAVDGTPEAVMHGITGLTVPPADPRALAEAICALLRDAELRRTLARQGRGWVETHFNREEQVQKTQDLYLRSVDERRRGLLGRCASRTAAVATLTDTGDSAGQQ